MCICITIYTFKSEVSMWGIPVKDGFVLVIVIDSIYRLVGVHYVNACLLKHKNTHFLVSWCTILPIRLSDYLK